MLAELEERGMGRGAKLGPPLKIKLAHRGESLEAGAPAPPEVPHQHQFVALSQD